MQYVTIVLPLIAIMGVGWFLRLMKIIKSDSDDLGGILYWGILPALLFRTIYNSGGINRDDVNLLCAVYLSFLIMPFLSLIFSPWKKDRKRLGVSLMTCIRSNNIYMGIPVVSLAMGDAGVMAVSKYLGVSLVGYQILSVMWGQIGLYGKINLNTLLKTAKEAAKNPLIVSCIFAFICSSFLHIRIPRWVDDMLRMLGEAATGLALIILGADMQLKEIVKSVRTTWVDTLMKVIVYPFLVMFLFSLWPVAHNVRNAVILVSAMPVAVNAFIVARGMNMDHKYAADLVAASTFASILIVPFWVAILF